VERLRPRIQQIVDCLLEAVRPQGRMDIVGDLSYPLPVSVIADMLGVAPEDRPRFKRWASDGLAGVVGRFASPEQRERARRSGEELQDYFRRTIARRRRQPGDDLVSALIAAQERGQALDDEEVLDNCTLLITAGHETTTNLLGNGMLALLRWPNQLRRLRDDSSLMTTAVEELLRYDPAVQTVTRRAKEDVPLGGRAVEKGQVVYAVIAAANRDPRRFPDPDRLDVGRRENPHLAFGEGIHFCLGAPLARAEAQIALGSLLHHFHRLRLVSDGGVEWGGNFIVRGVTKLPVEL